MAIINAVCICSVGAAFDEERVLRVDMDGLDSWWNRSTMYYTYPEWDQRLEA